MNVDGGALEEDLSQIAQKYGIEDFLFVGVDVMGESCRVCDIGAEGTDNGQNLIRMDRIAGAVIRFVNGLQMTMEEE